MGDGIVSYWVIPFLKPSRRTVKESVTQTILQPARQLCNSIVSGTLEDLVVNISDASSNQILENLLREAVPYLKRHQSLETNAKLQHFII